MGLYLESFTQYLHTLRSIEFFFLKGKQLSKDPLSQRTICNSVVSVIILSSKYVFPFFAVCGKAYKINNFPNYWFMNLITPSFCLYSTMKLYVIFQYI